MELPAQRTPMWNMELLLGLVIRRLDVQWITGAPLSRRNDSSQHRSEKWHPRTKRLWPKPQISSTQVPRRLTSTIHPPWTMAVLGRVSTYQAFPKADAPPRNLQNEHASVLSA
uniref:uncharacterized protein LOC117605535 isoform X2 n=1 Tax=Osmia lignaria TaxID=473952 RepID=UPI0014788924|nr:uncharacterized protein LOC117605535 isoform X2 [Osmia lignaria]